MGGSSWGGDDDDEGTLLIRAIQNLKANIFCPRFLWILLESFKSSSRRRRTADS